MITFLFCETNIHFSIFFISIFLDFGLYFDDVGRPLDFVVHDFWPTDYAFFIINELALSKYSEITLSLCNLWYHTSVQYSTVQYSTVQYSNMCFGIFSLPESLICNIIMLFFRAYHIAVCNYFQK